MDFKKKERGMKRIVAASLIALAFLATSCVTQDAFAKEYKIGYVDIGKVFDSYNKTKESEKALGEKAKAKEAESKAMLDELRKLKDEQALLSEKAKAEKQAILEEKARKLDEFNRKTQDELMKERNDMLAGILKDIEGVISVYSKEQGYDIVLNSRTLLYGKPEYDVTEEILKRVNK